jgi:hypothetical protein
VLPSSAKDRFTIDYEHVFFFTQARKYYFQQQFEPSTTPGGIIFSRGTTKGGIYEKNSLHSNWGLTRKEAKQFDYKGQAIKDYLPTKAQNPSDTKRRILASQQHQLEDTGQIMRNMRAVWRIPTQPYPESHFAVFPEALVSRILAAGCPEFVCKQCGKPRERNIIYEYKGATPKGGKYKGTGLDGTLQWERPAKREFKGWSDCGCGKGFVGGLVLDPFFGRGTTGIVAKRQKKRFVGIELSEEYVDLSLRELGYSSPEHRKMVQRLRKRNRDGVHNIEGYFQ